MGRKKNKNTRCVISKTGSFAKNASEFNEKWRERLLDGDDEI